MIVDERIITFINSLDTKNSEILEDIEREALADNVPIIRREMQSFLKVLLMVKKPMRVLEVGTAVGFSALLMSEYVPEECAITTIENYEKRKPIARQNFVRAGKEKKITLLEGDAMDVLKTLEGPYDFIFMDTNPTISLVNRNVITFSDVINVICETQPYSLNGLKLLVEDLDRFYSHTLHPR